MKPRISFMTKKSGAGIVAMMLVLIFAFMCVAVVFRVFPESNKDFAILLLNVLSANLGLVAGYLFRDAHDHKSTNPPEE